MARAPKVPAKECRGRAQLQAIAKKKGGANELARILRTDSSTVRSWLKGQCKPSALVRTTLAADLGIRREAWEELAGADDDVTAPATPAAPPPPPKLPEIPPNATALQLARYQLDRLYSEINYRRDVGISPSALAALEHQYQGAVRHYAKLSGETDVSVATILRSDAWRRIMSAMREWLEENGDGKVSRLVEKLQKLVDEEHPSD